MYGFYFLFAVYQCATLFSLPFLCFYFIYRAARGKSLWGSLKERLGFVPFLDSQSRPVIWIHAVSVGEVLSIQYFIEKLKKKEPNTLICVSTGTTTGRAMAEKNLKADCISFLPFDFLFPMMLLFKRWNPTRIFIVEAETWPNMLMLSKIYQIPVYGINARLKKYAIQENWMRRSYLRWAYSFFKHLYVQAKVDRERFKMIGVDEKRLSILGDVKAFNVLKKKEGRSDIFLEGIKTRDDLITILVGSVHPGELGVYLALFSHLKKAGKAVRMIIAPRHFHWKKELIAKVKKAGFSFAMWDESVHEPFEKDILLVCRLGILFDLYKYADIFYLGGTFVSVGGHNLLEPAAFGLPMFVGPFHGNCKATADALEEWGALKKVTNADQVSREVERLMEEQYARKEMGKRAEEWLQKEAKSVESILENL
jgi:3-deoxy-D-manno-octulosonic-acid transferase